MALSGLPRLRLVHFSDVYELRNLPRLQTFLARLERPPSAVFLGGDFLSPSALSALDGGKGMVATLRAIGVTHAILGNHEADLKIDVLGRRLQKLGRSVSLLNSNIGTIPDAPWFSDIFKPYDVIQTPCQRVNVAFGGFMSDEDGIFRDSTFRGGHIESVIESLDNVLKKSVISGPADVFVPLTHQTIARDRDIAYHLLQKQPGEALVLGGHEHSHHDEECLFEQQRARILKGESDAEAVHLVDLTFDSVDESFRIVNIEAELIPISGYQPSPVVQKIVDSHMSLLEQLKNETILDAKDFIPPGAVLSSERSRYKQTTVGGVLCHAVKEELGADVAVINGATIKGDKTYPTTEISYAQLSKELPFPTKMVVVEMTRKELQEVIFYSRTNPPTLSDGTEPERKGYLQVDFSFDRFGSHTGRQEEKLYVALPRNLLKGFCKIEPLMRLGERLQEERRLNLRDDDYLPAVDLVVKHFCRERWYDLFHDTSFRQLDRDNKGFLEREDVRTLIKDALGREPPSFVIDDMMTALDADGNGSIDIGTCRLCGGQLCCATSSMHL